MGKSTGRRGGVGGRAEREKGKIKEKQKAEVERAPRKRGKEGISKC